MFTRLDQLGLIAVRGADARAFLHAQFTCDIAALAPNLCRHGGYCTAKGRLLAVFLVWQWNDAFFLQIGGGQREIAQKQLSRFILRSKVTAADASAQYARIGVTGEGAAQAVEQVLGSVPAAPYDVRVDDDACVLRLPVERYEVVVAAARAPAIMDALKHHAAPVDPGVWEWHEVRAGFPVVTPATQEEFVPQMVNLDALGGLSFTKGCYPGQEIVARMHYLGRLKQRMYLAHLATDAAPAAGDRIYSARFGAQACGTIVRAAPAPGGGYDALSVVQIEVAQQGGARWRAQDGPALELLELPYSLNGS
jgi:folate-binding protein YgfZ